MKCWWECRWKARMWKRARCATSRQPLFVIWTNIQFLTGLSCIISSFLQAGHRAWSQSGHHSIRLIVVVKNGEERIYDGTRLWVIQHPIFRSSFVNNVHEIPLASRSRACAAPPISHAPSFTERLGIASQGGSKKSQSSAVTMAPRDDLTETWSCSRLCAMASVRRRCIVVQQASHLMVQLVCNSSWPIGMVSTFLCWQSYCDLDWISKERSHISPFPEFALMMRPIGVSNPVTNDNWQHKKCRGRPSVLQMKTSLV